MPSFSNPYQTSEKLITQTAAEFCLYSPNIDSWPLEKYCGVSVLPHRLRVNDGTIRCKAGRLSGQAVVAGDEFACFRLDTVSCDNQVTRERLATTGLNARLGSIIVLNPGVCHNFNTLGDCKAAQGRVEVGTVDDIVRCAEIITKVGDESREADGLTVTPTTKGHTLWLNHEALEERIYAPVVEKAGRVWWNLYSSPNLSRPYSKSSVRVPVVTMIISNKDGLTSRSSLACSKTVTRCPLRARATEVARPPSPAPTTITCKGTAAWFEEAVVLSILPLQI